MGVNHAFAAKPAGALGQRLALAFSVRPHNTLCRAVISINEVQVSRINDDSPELNGGENVLAT